MLEELFTPIEADLIDDVSLTHSQWGSQLQIYQNTFPDLADIVMAIVGIGEGRASLDNGCAIAPNEVRRQLYRLYNWEPDFQIADLGNIKGGETLQDSLFAVQTIVQQLLEQNIIPILIGGTHDLTYGQFLGHSALNELVNVAVIDERTDLLFNEDVDGGITPQSFLYKIIANQPNLQHFAHIGHQRYLVDEQMVETLEKLHFECFRLGDIRQNMEEVEAIIRNTHLVSFDIGAIRQSDAPGRDMASPNGFLGEEACRITRYIGMSNEARSIGFYQYNPFLDRNKQTAQLIAQMIWYFVDGYYHRRYEQPDELDKYNYLTYIVHLKSSKHEIVFLKSKKSDRWWMKVPLNAAKQTEGASEKYTLVPCTYRDYELACTKEEIPERWMRAYLRQ